MKTYYRSPLVQSLLNYAIWNGTSPFDGEHPNDIEWQLTRDPYWNHEAYERMNEIYGKDWVFKVWDIINDPPRPYNENESMLAISFMILIEREWVIIEEEQEDKKNRMEWDYFKGRVTN